jgi:STE24 endopeptidase
MEKEKNRKLVKKMHFLLDKEKQEQARRYEKEKRMLGLFGTLLSLIILLAFYYSGMSGRLADLFVGRSMILAFLVYTTVFLSGFALLTLPLNFWRGYIREHKWKFSNQTVKNWLWEKAKSFVVGWVILSALLGFLLWIMAHFAQTWWFMAGIGTALLSVILAAFFPVVILPIFNKYVPIQDKELTEALDRILSQGGLRSSGFFQEDTSRQTKKENAFLAGLGKTRRVVLSDNLMRNMTIPEIESIMAHEVGHFKHKHIWKNMAIGALGQLVIFYVLNLIMRSLFPPFLSSPRSNLALFPMLLILLEAISSILFGPSSHALSRHFEKQADHYALRNIQSKKAFMTALAGLADRNLSNAYPRWWVKLLYYSHPPIGERLDMADTFNTRLNFTP